MAKYVAENSTYPTIGAVLAFIAVRSGLVSATDDDPLYERLKPFVREQKGKDFAELEFVLDVLQRRLEGRLAPPEVGNLTFVFFRRFLERYKSLIQAGRASVFGRDHFMNEILIPKFFVPYAAFILRELSRIPFDFFDLDQLLRSDAPLRVMLEIPLKAKSKDWNHLAELYEGKHLVRGEGEPEHDIDDKRKLIRRWGSGDATPDLTICLALLDGLDWAKYSGFVFWVWIARFLQKIDKSHRVLVADAVRLNEPLPDVHQFSKEITNENDAISRMSIRQDAVVVLRNLSALLFYDTYRNFGDKARVEGLLADVRLLVEGKDHIKYYVTWLEAKYWLYCRDYNRALEKYEQAFYEGMYGDSQAETMILPQWAAVAQKQNAKSALKRIDSRMKFLRIYPNGLGADGVAAMRLEAFRTNFGAGRHFIECF
ncbi:hypothetical protein CSZ94_27035 [Janthinobacterium sp. ROICE36]|uniref:hypothetical protein n=1 Tax=Janthinobacterium sp. ROICE36 TaxID=2048670 RepID=UPI000C7EA1F7|nr:hypothetical protein [Janthinobacterium sp. ROICE36]PLY39331.1 hypothetical protein CSZ94_27035 [Janthinobacterium sp. ROICE36]